MEPQDQVDHKAIRDQASLWLARLDSGSADVEAFEHWRDAHPAHAAAFAKTARLWSRLGDTHVALDLPKAATPPAPARPGAPCVWLDRGEAAVTVPPSSKSPCVLKAGDITVDLGAGEFNARLRGDSLNLLVLRGTGALRASPGSRAPTASFERGQKVVATASDAFVQKASTESLDEVSAWRRGEIVFQGAPLGAVVEDYNRYLTKKLVIADPELSKLRLGGRFTNSDPSDFLNTLSSSFGVRAVDAGDNTIMLTRAE
jgi:ferric-dicitrate binding protein FerR (iron transport regulator)